LIKTISDCEEEIAPCYHYRALTNPTSAPISLPQATLGEQVTPVEQNIQGGMASLKNPVLHKHQNVHMDWHPQRRCYIS